jgi:hypothetical protein
MRLSLFLFCGLTLLSSSVLRAEPLPDELASVLKSFRADGAKGWAFTQTTTATKNSLVERYEPMKPDGSRWLLVEKDGRAPTEDELKDYREKQTRRTSGDTAPDVIKQLDLASAERVSDDAERVTYRFKLNPGGDDDKSAAHMRASVTVHKATKTVERFELGNSEPFSPMLTVKIEEARTVMQYSLPTPERPALLEKVTMRIRGRAMWFKSLDEDMTVQYSDYRYVAKPAKSAP